MTAVCTHTHIYTDMYPLNLRPNKPVGTSTPRPSVRPSSYHSVLQGTRAPRRNADSRAGKVPGKPEPGASYGVKTLRKSIRKRWRHDQTQQPACHTLTGHTGGTLSIKINHDSERS